MDPFSAVASPSSGLSFQQALLLPLPSGAETHGWLYLASAPTMGRQLPSFERFGVGFGTLKGQVTCYAQATHFRAEDDQPT